MEYFQALRLQNVTNVNTVSWILGVLIFCISLYWLFLKRKHNLPPGPWCWPVLGYTPFLREDVIVVSKRLSEKYGKIVSLYLGPAPLVLLNDYELVKEAFDNPALQDRPPKLFDFYPDGLGFAMQSGDEWREQRRFSIKALKDIGLGKTEWQENLAAEINDFLKTLEAEEGKPYDIEPLVSATISNIMISICLGKRFPLGDPIRKVVDDGVSAVTRTFNDNSAIVMIFPNVMKFICKMGLTRFAEQYRKMCTFSEFIITETESRKKTIHEDDKVIFVDEYIREMERVQKKKMNTFFNDHNLRGMCKSVVIGGSDTTRTSLLWLILAMVSFPEIQKRVQDEIETTLGKQGVITWPERTKLPYTYATILEVLRWKAPGPLGVLHRASEDTKIAGYDIPKGTNVASNISFIHYDEKKWDDPTTFKPERFLDKEGKVFTNHVDNYLPFAVGKRVCPGELIANIELFLFLVYILQKFDILASKENPPDLDGLRTGKFQPNNQELRYVLRN